MKIGIKATALIAPALFLGAVPANAAVEIMNYEFEANTPDTPIENHKGSFSLAFNKTTRIYTLRSINFSIGDTIFTRENTGVLGFGDGSDGFVVGGLDAFGNLGISTGTTDFFIQSGLGPATFIYTIAGFDVLNDGGEFSLREVNSAVPEPATWGMMLLGFGFIGGAMRSAKLRQKHTVSYA